MLVLSEALVLGFLATTVPVQDGGSTQVPGLSKVDPVAKLTEEFPAPNVQWGDCLDASANTLAVGEAGNRGHLTIFERNALGDWEHRVTHDFQDTFFPTAIAASDDTVAASFTPFFSASPSSQNVRIFERDKGGPGQWGLAQTIPLEPCGAIANCSTQSRLFGSKLALTEERLFVADPMLTDLGGPGGDGAVFVYERDPVEANWQLVKTITGGPAEFGLTLSAADDLVAVTNFGQLFVYQRDLGGTDNYGLVTSVPAPRAESLLLRDDLLVVGAPTFLLGIPGQVVVHERNAGGLDAWNPVATLRPRADEFSFGRTMAILDDQLYVGVSLQASSLDPGRVEVFQRDVSGPRAWRRAWSFQQPAGTRSTHFGGALAAAGGLLFVGDALDDEAFNNAGAAWILAPNEAPAPGSRPTFGVEPK